MIAIRVIDKQQDRLTIITFIAIKTIITGPITEIGQTDEAAPVPSLHTVAQPHPPLSL